MLPYRYTAMALANRLGVILLMFIKREIVHIENEYVISHTIFIQPSNIEALKVLLLRVVLAMSKMKMKMFS
jgi:hypothetical protein